MLLWLLMNLRISALLWRALKRSPKRSASYDVTLWCLLLYVLGMLVTTVQPWLEFSYGAVPFFLLVGFAMGIGKRGISHAARLSVSARRSAFLHGNTTDESCCCPQPLPALRR